MRGALARGGRWVAAVAASVGLGWLAARGLDWGAVVDSLARTSIPLLAAALAIFLVALCLRAYRWRILFIAENITTRRLFVVQNEGIGLNNLVPFRIASEATQLGVLSLRDKVSGPKALATLGMERVLDAVASTGLLAAAFFLVPEVRNFALYIWGALTFTALAVALVRFLAWGNRSLAFVRRSRFLLAFTAALRDLERERWRLVASLAVTAGYWLLVGVTAWVTALAVGLHVSPVTATVAIMGTVFFATAVPALPSSIGTFEAAVVYVLEFFGVERSASFPFAVVVHGVLFLPSTVIAALCLPGEGIVTARELRRLIAGSSAGARW